MLGCYHSNIINEYLFNMAGETEDKIPMPFENSPEKSGSFTGLVESTIDSTIVSTNLLFRLLNR